MVSTVVGGGTVLLPQSCYLTYRILAYLLLDFLISVHLRSSVVTFVSSLTPSPTKPISLPDTLSDIKSQILFLCEAPNPRQQNKKPQLPHPMPILPVEGNLRREFTVTVKRGKNVQKHNNVQCIPASNGAPFFSVPLRPPPHPQSYAQKKRRGAATLDSTRV